MIYMYIYIYIYVSGYHPFKKQCIVSNDVLIDAQKHIDCGDKAGGYRFKLCQFLDAVESPVGQHGRSVSTISMNIQRTIWVYYFEFLSFTGIFLFKRSDIFTGMDLKFLLFVKSIGFNYMSCLF